MTPDMMSDSPMLLFLFVYPCSFVQRYIVRLPNLATRHHKYIQTVENRKKGTGRRKSEQLDKRRETPKRRYRYNPTCFQGSPSSSIVNDLAARHRVSFSYLHFEAPDAHHRRPLKSTDNQTHPTGSFTSSLTLYPAASYFRPSSPSSVACFAGGTRCTESGPPLAAEATGESTPSLAHEKQKGTCFGERSFQHPHGKRCGYAPPLRWQTPPPTVERAKEETARAGKRLQERNLTGGILLSAGKA